MILRKPYAFFIKHFRLLHFILSFLMLYCTYYSKKILDFFNEYIIESVNLKDQDLISIYAPKLYQIVPFLIIIVLIIILVVLFLKKKPTMIYISNVISYIYTIIIIQISISILDTLSSTMVDVRTIRLIRDFIMISFILQIISTIIFFIRSVGFDIKKFDFKEDLKELEINEEDREEFELEINVDKNKLRRNVRKNIRFLKYSYKENKLLIQIVSITLVILTIFATYYLYTKKEKTFKENEYITNNGITLKINKSYITNTDYKGNIIDEDSIFVILQIDIKTNNSDNTLDIATSKLSVGEYSYIPTYEYKESFFDFGNVYLGDKLTNEYQNKILVYQIPKQLIDKKIEFNFVNKSTMSKIRVKLNLNNLISLSDEVKVNIKEELDLKDSILSEYKLSINSFDIQKKYKLNYGFCYDSKCYESYEYIVPSISTNVDKSILKIDGTLSGNKTINKLNNLYDIISNFGTLYYDVDGNTKTNKTALKQVVSNKTKENNIFYIEVPSELESASSISIKFKIRNKIYEYVLK